MPSLFQSLGKSKTSLTVRDLNGRVIASSQAPLTVRDLDGNAVAPPTLTLEEKLDLAFKAVAYAKERCPRSDNQRYFKTLHPSADQERAHFLLNLARFEPADPFRREMERKVQDIVGDPNLTQAAKNEQIDRIIKGVKNLAPEWKGANFFGVGQNRRAKLEQELHSNDLWARLGYASKLDGSTERVEHTAEWAENAGAGNCGEKSALTVEYLRRHAPPGNHIAWVSYDKNYKNGDHAFCVFGSRAQLTNGGNTSIGQWGSEAVLIDGWMNDAYPASHPFAWKYGYNYNGVRINPKQMAVRTKLCVTFREHLTVMGSWTT